MKIEKEKYYIELEKCEPLTIKLVELFEKENYTVLETIFSMLFIIEDIKIEMGLEEKQLKQIRKFIQKNIKKTKEILEG